MRKLLTIAFLAGALLCLDVYLVRFWVQHRDHFYPPRETEYVLVPVDIPMSSIVLEGQLTNDLILEKGE